MNYGKKFDVLISAKHSFGSDCYSLKMIYQQVDTITPKMVNYTVLIVCYGCEMWGNSPRSLETLNILEWAIRILAEKDRRKTCKPHRLFLRTDKIQLILFESGIYYSGIKLFISLSTDIRTVNNLIILINNCIKYPNVRCVLLS